MKIVVVMLLTNRDVAFTFNCSVAYLAGELSVCGISRKCKTLLSSVFTKIYSKTINKNSKYHEIGIYQLPFTMPF